MAEAKVTIRAVDEASATLKNIQRNFEGLIGGLKTVVSFEALKMLGDAVRTAGEQAVKFIETQTAAAEALRNLSDVTGISVKNLQVLQFSFRTNGIAAETLETSIKFLNKAISEQNPLLAKLGVTSHDTFTALIQAAQGLAALKDPTERVTQTMEIFGSRGGTRAIPVLLELAKAFGRVSQDAKDTGNVFDDLAFDKMLKMENAVDGLKVRWEGFWKQAAAGMAPTITKMLVVIEHLIDIGNRINKIPWFARGAAIVLGAEIQLPAREKPMLGPGNEQGAADFKAWLADQEKAAAAAAKKLAEWKEKLITSMRFEPKEISERASFERVFDEITKGVARSRESMLKLIQVQGPADDPGLQFGEWAESALRNADRIASAMAQLRDSMLNGFAYVFQNLTNKMQTFGSAGKAIIDSMVQGILAAVGELLASEAIKWFFKLLGLVVGSLTGNPLLGGAIGSVGEVGGAGLGNATTAANKFTAGANVAAAPAARGGGNTFVIQTLSPRDVLGELLSPTGAMRTADSRLSEIAAASG